MKIVIVNTSDSMGGAAIAANRLMTALNKNGIDVKMLVCDKQTKDDRILTLKAGWLRRWFFLWERLFIWFHLRLSRKQLFAVDVANVGPDITKLPVFKEADIVHIHWINQGFLSLKAIDKILHSEKAVVWTMHDMWPFTGICHHAGVCEEYKRECARCPLLPHSSKLAKEIHTKKSFLSKSALSVVAVSSWLRNKALDSSLFSSLPITVIPNVVDTTLFCPKDKNRARLKVGLPARKRIILMGAAKLNDTIKGFSILRESLRLLPNKEEYLLLLFGNIKNEPTFLEDIPIKTIYVGVVSNINELVNLYAAADVTVVPSLYETFGQTLSESMACGRTVVAFDNSGQTDVIDHKINGYLAHDNNPSDLVRGIEWVLSDLNYETLCRNAREKVEHNFSEHIVAQRYIELYESLLNKNNN